MKFDADFLGARHLQKTGRAITVVSHFRIGGVMNSDDVVFPAEIGHFGEKNPISATAAVGLLG